MVDTRNQIVMHSTRRHKITIFSTGLDGADEDAWRNYGG